MVKCGFRTQITYPILTLLKISVHKCVLSVVLLIAEEKDIRNKWIKSYY